MYPNLYAELARRGKTKRDLAAMISMPYSTLLDKLNGRTQFTLAETVKIKEAIKSDLAIDILFFTKN